MRFTIRDVLWLTVLVAVTLTMGLGWLGERSRLMLEINEMNTYHHTEMIRLERELTEIWLEKLTKEIESSNQQRQPGPTTDSRP
jgi:hypothetical protein